MQQEQTEESPEAVAAPAAEELIDYAGFLRRLAATLIDTILMIVVLALLAIPLALLGMPIMMGHSGSFLITDIIPMVIVIAFWFKFGATPGKQLLDCHIVDARSGGPLSLWQSILRYLGYILSTLPFFLGFLWIIWSPRKQGFHDYIARTVVIRRGEPHHDPEAGKPIEQFIKENL